MIYQLNTSERKGSSPKASYPEVKTVHSLCLIMNQHAGNRIPDTGYRSVAPCGDRSARRRLLAPFNQAQRLLMKVVY